MSHIPVPPYDGFPPTGGPALRPTKGLATAVSVLLYAVIATDLFALGADLNMRALLGDLATVSKQEPTGPMPCTRWPPSSRAASCSPPPSSSSSGSTAPG